MATGKKTGGRIKGTQNKNNVAIRDAFKMLVEGNIEQLKLDIKELRPAERVRSIIELSKFCVPTLKAIEYTDSDKEEKKDPVFITFVKK